MKKIKSKIHGIIGNFKYRFSYLRVIFSPLRMFGLYFYFGEIKIGTPYFLPRKFIKDVENPGHLKAVPIKYFGINYHMLGWKTKYDDYRFEYNPGLSIVMFGKQLYIGIFPKIYEDRYDIYWEAWLYYKDTNKKLSIKERLFILFDIYSCTWISSEKGEIDYYPYILKKKYIKYYDEFVKNRKNDRNGL